MIRTTLISASLVLAGSTAFAGNMSEPVIVAAPVVPMAPMAPSADWTGFYIGGQYINGDADIDDDFDDFTASLDYDGFGVHAGYLRDFGTFVLGGELDYDMGELSTDDGDIDADIFRAKAIAGYDLGSFMPYITAGVGRVSVGDDADFDEEDSLDLTFYGIGGAYQISDNFRVGGEYIMHDVDTEIDGVDLDVDTFSLRASFTF